MLIDGEKYACEACIRGHRVSSCNHSERELVHVARKGRPISQCQHCRGQRKARSQHVNCQCGATAHDKEHCPSTDGKGDSHGCCCSHTSQCTCAIKKDKNAQVVHDDGSQPLHPRESPKPLAHIKNCHDNKPMIFTGNGHHKPAHKFNDAHHQLGSPYKIPSRASSVHHHQSLAQRSTDSLPLTKFARPHHESPLHHSLTPRQIKSEHNSPLIRPTNVPNAIPNDLLLPEYDPNAYSYSPFSSNTSTVPDSTQNTLGLNNQYTDGFAMPFSQPEEVQSQQNVDWGSYDFTAFGDNPSNNSYLNEQSFLTNQTLPLASEQFGNLNLGMTPSSGDVTDVDEFGFSRADQPRSQSGDASTGVSSPENSQMDRYRRSVEGTPVMQNNLIANDDGLDIDDYLRQAQEETKRLSLQNQMRQMVLQQALSQNNSQENLLQQSQTPSQSHTPLRPGPDFTAAMHPFTVHEAQERAHSADITPAPEMNMNMKPTMAIPANALGMDPSWSAPPDMTDPTLSLDDAQEDEDWVR